MGKVRLGLARVLGPDLTAPGGDLASGDFLRHALPPDVTVLGKSNVGVNAVGVQASHGVVVGLVGRAGSDTEEASLGVDGVETTVGAELEPGYKQKIIRNTSTSANNERYPPISSPTHSTVQPGRVGLSIARLVLPQALGKAAAT